MSVRDVRQGGRAVGLPAPARSGPSLTARGAILLVVALATVGAVFDALTGSGTLGLGPGLRWGFTVGLVAGALLAAVLVRRDAMLWVVLTPPLVYLIASTIAQLLQPGGLVSTGGALNFLTGLLGFGFPAMAAATGGAAVIAAIRLAASRTR
jgi:hypothetical protein